MKALILVVAMAGGGCANVHVNRAALVASTAALVCDWGQTYRAADGGWMSGPTGQQAERNPIMGPTPNTQVVNMYFVSALAINGLIWASLPMRYRTLLPGMIVGAQTHAINNNMQTGTGVCGL